MHVGHVRHGKLDFLGEGHVCCCFEVDIFLMFYAHVLKLKVLFVE